MTCAELFLLARTGSGRDAAPSSDPVQRGSPDVPTLRCELRAADTRLAEGCDESWRATSPLPQPPRYNRAAMAPAQCFANTDDPVPLRFRLGPPQDPLFSEPCTRRNTPESRERARRDGLSCAHALAAQGHFEWAETLVRRNDEERPVGVLHENFGSPPSSLLNGRRARGLPLAGSTLLQLAERSAPEPLSSDQEMLDAFVLEELECSESRKRANQPASHEHSGIVARQRIRSQRILDEDDAKAQRAAILREDQLLRHLTADATEEQRTAYMATPLEPLQHALEEIAIEPPLPSDAPHTVYSTAKAQFKESRLTYRDAHGARITWPWEADSPRDSRPAESEYVGSGVLLQYQARHHCRAPHRMDSLINEALDKASKDGHRGRNATGVKRWFAFCRALGVCPGRPMDPMSPLIEKLEEEWLAMRFVCSLVEDEGLAVGSARVYFSSFQGWHAREYGVKLAGGLKLERLPQMLKGLRRMYGDGGRQQRIPISPERLRAAMDRLFEPSNPLHANMRAATATAFQGLLRSAEYCGKAHADMLLRSDIVSLSELSLVIMMHPCKNMLHLTGKTVPLVIGAGGRFIDAVAEVANMLRVDPSRDAEATPLFRDPSTNKPISYDAMNRATKELYVLAGMDPNSAGTHIFRISGATALFADGGSDTIIRTMGRWSSDLYRLYVRACFEQCQTWSARIGSASFSPTAVIIDEVDDY